MTAFVVFLGAGLGGGARYGIGRLMATSSTSFPWGTLLINVTGSLLITWFAGIVQARSLSQNTQLFLTVGLCGGFTTFSAFSAETLSLMQSGHTGRAATYALASLVLCVAASFAGYKLA